MVSCELSYRVVETRRAIQAFDGQRGCPKQTGLSGFVSVGCWHTRAAFISERPDPVGIVAAISQQHGSRLVTSWQMLVRLNRTHRRLFRLPCASYAL